jgi:hypothetical protein
MAILTSGTTFVANTQISVTDLNNAVNASTFTSGAVDSSTTQLSSGAIIVKDGGITAAKITSTSSSWAFVGNITSSFIGPLAATTISASGAITPSQTAGLIGTTTNNDANTGSVGEYVTANQATSSPLSLTSNIARDVISVSLTAGDWDVQGIPYFSLGTTTTCSGISCWISTTSATYPGFSGATTAYNIAIAAAAGQAIGLPTPTVRISLSGTTTVYMSAACTFATSTMTVAGSIRARRVR